MTVKTRSSFLYGYTIDQSNLSIDIDEGSGYLPVELNVGSYTATEMAVEIARALTDIGNQEYSCSFNRVTRTFTISALSSFTIDFATGPRLGTTAGLVLGFTVDVSGTSVESDTATGTVYKPQFLLQDYVHPDDFQEANYVNINESASGIVEVVRFGKRKFFEFNISFITDIAQAYNGPIENNPSAVSDTRLFLRFATDKNKFEFMPDRNDVNTYYKVLLESTPASGDGVSYRLQELYSRGLIEYYETGKLRLRLIED